MASGWAACNRCATLIERNQWDLMAARVVSILEGTYESLLVPDSDLMASVVFVYEQLRKNITGPLELLDE